MGCRAGDTRSAFLRSSCAAVCSGPNSNGTPLRIRLTRGLVHFAKCRMNMQHTPIMPKNAQTSETFLQGPHLEILLIYLGLGSRPCDVQWCLTVTISSAQRIDLYPLNVPPLYLIHCTTWLRFWKCSQTKRRIPGLSGMRSSDPSVRRYRPARLQIGTSSMYSTVVSDISGCRMWVTSSWKMGMELVQPIGRVTRQSSPNRDWNVVRSHDALDKLCSL